MPTQPAPQVQPEDGLVHWMMAHAGRPGGYLARPKWDDRSQDWDPGTRWWILDLLTCQDGASAGEEPEEEPEDVCTPVPHENSEQMLLFIGVYVVGTAFIVNVLRVAFNTWVRSQKGMAKQLSQAFFGRKGDKTRQRLSQVAHYCRREIQGSKGANLHERTAEFFSDKTKVGWKASYTEDDKATNFGDVSEAGSPRPHQNKRKVNRWLTKKQFTRKFVRVLKAMEVDPRGEAEKDGKAQWRRGDKLLSWKEACYKISCLTVGAQSFEEAVCMELFEQACGDDEYISPDGECRTGLPRHMPAPSLSDRLFPPTEIQTFILFYDEDVENAMELEGEALSTMSPEDALEQL